MYSPVQVLPGRTLPTERTLLRALFFAPRIPGPDDAHGHGGGPKHGRSWCGQGDRPRSPSPETPVAERSFFGVVAGEMVGTGGWCEAENHQMSVAEDRCLVGSDITAGHVPGRPWLSSENAKTGAKTRVWGSRFGSAAAHGCGLRM